LAEKQAEHLYEQKVRKSLGLLPKKKKAQMVKSKKKK
jgi:hypothetical protein